MALVGKYGQVDIPGIGADEPVFILRAQDRAALAAIEAYGDECERLGSPGLHCASIDDVRHTFQGWQATNYTKVPD